MMRATVDARERIDRYLREVRDRLRPYPGIDEEEVVRDVREHIEAALGAESRPVGEAAAARVIERLGPPESWVPTEELSPARAALTRLRHGPEDWRLAYLSAGSFGLGLVLPALGLPPVIGLMFIVAAWVSGRAAIELAPEGDGRGQRWLAWPAVVAVQVALAAALLLWPLALVLPVGATGGWIDALGESGRALPSGGSPEAWRLTGCVVGVLQGVWWMAFGWAAARRPERLRRLLFPLGRGITSRPGRSLAVAGLLIVAASSLIWALG